MKLQFPFRLPSPNQTATEHWSKRHKRGKNLNRIIRILWRASNSQLQPPCDVILTRIAPRTLDSHDNLPAAFKQVVDIIADLLIPGKQKGQADSSERITWLYKQQKGPYSIAIEILPKSIEPLSSTVSQTQLQP